MAAKNDDKILGIVYAYDCDGSDYDKVRDLGLKWIRLGICFPWKDQMYGTLCTEYLEAKEKFRQAKEHGILVMPSTPGLGSYRYDEKEGRTRWHDSFPAFVGEKGTEEFYRNVSETTRFMCEDLGDLAGDLWQCMNEIDIPTFSGDYSDMVAADTARASAAGIVAANPAARCGINLSRCWDVGLAMADKVYRPGHCFSYIGDDQYFGSWQGRTVEAWNDVIDTLYERYRLPVLANEWGYSSGGTLVKKDLDPSEIPVGLPETCYVTGWFHEVYGGHNQETQAEYLRRGLEIFAKHPHALGSFLFCWRDARHCYHCGREACPSECMWGLIDKDENPKKAFYAVKEAIQSYY